MLRGDRDAGAVCCLNCLLPAAAVDFHCSTFAAITSVHSCFFFLNYFAVYKND